MVAVRGMLLGRGLPPDGRGDVCPLGRKPQISVSSLLPWTLPVATGKVWAPEKRKGRARQALEGEVKEAPDTAGDLP